MSYYAVIDTHVLVSAMMSKYDDAATVLIVNKMISGEIIPVLLTSRDFTTKR